MKDVSNRSFLILSLLSVLLILGVNRRALSCQSFDFFPLSYPVHGWITSDATFLLNSQYPYYGGLYSYLDKIVQGSIHQDCKGVTDADEYGTRIFWKTNNETRSYFTDKKERQHSQGKYMWIKIPLEFIGGCIGGCVGAFLGICLLMIPLDGVSLTAWTILFGGWSLGASLGVYVVGKIMGEEGSFVKTILGSIIGSTVGTGIGYLIEGRDFTFTTFIMGLGGAPIGATIGYNLSLKRKESYSFIDEGELLGNEEKGFKVSFITINF